MRIRYKTSGGIAFFPGLSEPLTFETEELPEEEALELKRHLEEARFFELPATLGEVQRGAADYRQYTITVEDGERNHTVRVADPIEDPGLGNLVDHLDWKAKTLRARGITRPDKRR